MKTIPQTRLDSAADNAGSPGSKARIGNTTPRNSRDVGP